MNFDHKPHRGDKLQPLDEISGYKVRPGFYDRNGAAQAANGVSFTIHSMGATGCTLLLFRPKEQEPFAKKYVIRKLTVLEAHIPCWYLG